MLKWTIALEEWLNSRASICGTRPNPIEEIHMGQSVVHTALNNWSEGAPTQHNHLLYFAIYRRKHIIEVQGWLVNAFCSILTPPPPAVDNLWFKLSVLHFIAIIYNFKTETHLVFCCYLQKIATRKIIKSILFKLEKEHAPDT